MTGELGKVDMFLFIAATFLFMAVVIVWPKKVQR